MSDDLFDELGVPRSDYRVHVCLGPNCSLRGSKAILTRFDEAIWSRGLQRKVEVMGTSCRDRCEFGPSVNVYPGPVLYNHVNSEAVDAIVDEHLEQGQIVDRYLFRGKPGRCPVETNPRAPGNPL